jgi:hypothetical protein
MPKWQQAYTALSQFIAGHPEIEIKPNSSCIPETVRPEFYNLFDQVRRTYIEEIFPNLVSEARMLSASFLAAEVKVKAQLNLEKIVLKQPLDLFVADPVAGLQLSLFHPLFDRLGGKIDTIAFEQSAQFNITGDFRALFRLGYERWLALSLITLLSADELLQVHYHETERSQVMEIETPGTAEEAPYPEPSNVLSFEHMGYILFTVPDYIIHSKVLGKYLSIRTVIDKPIAVASNRSELRTWIPFDTTSALAPGVIPVYLSDSPGKLSILSDRENFCCPDLLIECRSNPDWQNFESLDVIKYHHDVLKPTLGTIIIVREPVSEPFFTVVGDDIYLLRAGFDSTKLEPLIKLLMKQESGIKK